MANFQCSGQHFKVQFYCVTSHVYILLKLFYSPYRSLWVDPVPYWRNKQNNSSDNNVPSVGKVPRKIHPITAKPRKTKSEVIATTTAATTTSTSPQPGKQQPELKFEVVKYECVKLQ